MLSKNKIKFINTLKKKKTRNETGLFLAEGEKIVKEIINSSMKIEFLFSTKDFLNNLTENEKINIQEIIEISEPELRKISSLTTPNQVIAVVNKPSYSYSTAQVSNTLVLGLDNINDPGNLGTILRIADWFGIQNVFCSENTVDLFNPKTVQATMGAICRVKVFYKDLHELIIDLKTEDSTIYGCLLEGNNIYTQELIDKGLILMGSESHGISESLIPKLDQKLYIPNFSDNAFATSESLNVSIATGIVCSEFKRRSLHHSK
jgi:TrmH family RNA methyltransferase